MAMFTQPAVPMHLSMCWGSKFPPSDGFGGGLLLFFGQAQKGLPFFFFFLYITKEYFRIVSKKTKT